HPSYAPASSRFSSLPRTRRTGNYRTGGGATVFVSSIATGRRMEMPRRTGFGFDFLFLAGIVLITGVLTFFALTGIMPKSYWSDLSSVDRGMWTTFLGKASADILPPMESLQAGPIRFERLLLCQSIDRDENPVGAQASFTVDDIRTKGIAVYSRFSSTV